jgi:prepilin-type N-terminal cleavage/methylation domain-containing protein
MRHGQQGGFTLVELMIALLVSSLLVGMILAIFSRMSLAYRGQQQIAGVQQVLAAARGVIELDAKQAGLGIAQGFTTNPTGSSVQSPAQVFDSSTGPDQVRFFYADTSTQAVVSGSSWPMSLDLAPATGLLPGEVDPVAQFLPGDLIVLSRAFTNTIDNLSPNGGANRAMYIACVARISPASGSVVLGSPDRIVLDTTLPWGWGGIGNGPCVEMPVPGQTMVYKFVAHAYRIDTSTQERAALGPLQQSVTGGLLGGAEVWNDLAYGFTDIQAAERFVLLLGPLTAPVDPDGDGDSSHDWYSDRTQDAMNTVPPEAVPPDPIPPVVAAQPRLMQMSISLVARTDRDVEGIATRATPNLIDPDHPNNSPLGNRASIPLPSTTDLALGGQRIYRYVTFQVDFRNLGVGL